MDPAVSEATSVISDKILEGLLQPQVIKLWLLVLLIPFVMIFLRALLDRMGDRLAKKYQGKRLSDTHLLILLLISLGFAVAIWMSL